MNDAKLVRARILTAMGFGLMGAGGCDAFKDPIEQERSSEPKLPPAVATAVSDTPLPVASMGVLPEPTLIGSVRPTPQTVLPTTILPPPVGSLDLSVDAPQMSGDPGARTYYWSRRIGSTEFVQLCGGPGLGSAQAFLFCTPNQAPGQACGVSPTGSEALSLARGVSCGLGFSPSGGCGPFPWAEPYASPAASVASVPSVNPDTQAGTSNPGQVADALDASALDSTSAQSPLLDAAGAEAALVPMSDSSVPLQIGACCWAVAGYCAVGRPFRVDGVARSAPLLASENQTWGQTMVLDVAELTQAEREQLAQMWLAEARAEHASIASFSRFTLQCLALGAPADIVLKAQQAGLEEWQHAQTAFGLATAYGAPKVNPQGLDVSGALGDSVDPVGIALSTASEGCVAETVAALLLAEARDAATEPTLKRILAQVAEEEMRHAELAWRFLGWALTQHAPRLRQPLEALFANAEAHVGFGALSQKHDNPRLRNHGCLSQSEQREISVRALKDVVRPLAQQILAATLNSEQQITGSSVELQGRSHVAKQESLPV